MGGWRPPPDRKNGCQILTTSITLQPKLQNDREWGGGGPQKNTRSVRCTGFNRGFNDRDHRDPCPVYVFQQNSRVRGWRPPSTGKIGPGTFPACPRHLRGRSAYKHSPVEEGVRSLGQTISIPIPRGGRHLTFICDCPNPTRSESKAPKGGGGGLGGRGVREGPLGGGVGRVSWGGV